MKNRFKSSLVLGVVLVALAGLVFWLGHNWLFTRAALPAPTFTLTGDDYNLNGGIDDPYDSYIVVKPQSNLDHWTDYLLDYSNDSGHTWQKAQAEVKVAAAAINSNPDPVAWLHFDEGSSDTVYDSSQYNYRHTIAGPYQWTNGKFNSGLDLISATTSVYENLPNGNIIANNEVTFSAWVNVMSPQNAIGGTLLGSSGWGSDLDSPGQPCWGYTLRLENDGANAVSPRVDYNNYTSGWQIIQAPSLAIPLNTWAFVAMVVDQQNNQITLYVNNNKVVFPKNSLPHCSSVGQKMGNALWGGLLNTVVDETRIYNQALTSAQMTLDYNNISKGTPYDPAIYWKFDEGAGSTLADSSGNNYNTAVNGNYSWVSGLFGSALNLADASLNPLPATALRTDKGAVSFWLNPSAIPNQGYLYWHCSNNNCTGNDRFYFRSEVGGGLTVGFGDKTLAFPSNTITLNQWQNFTVSYNNGVFYVYKNGVLLGSQSFAPFSFSAPIYFSQWPDFRYYGSVDDFKFFTNYLNSNDVSSLYTGSNNFQNNLTYYWPLNSLGSQDILLRVAGQTAYGVSDATVQTVKIRHRFGSLANNYVVENFLNSSHEDFNNSTAFWNNQAGVLQFSNQVANCPAGPVVAQSNNLLAGLNNLPVVTSVTWQAAQLAENNSNIAYTFSTDGQNWEPATTLNGTLISNPQTLTFSHPIQALYWRATLTRGNSCDLINQPQVLGLRFSWQYNHAPRACFKVSPTRSDSSSTVFAFNASCSSDLEDNANQLSYKWDLNGQSKTGLNLAYSFGNTLQQNVVLTVTDSLGATSTFSQTVNAPVFLGGQINGWGWSPYWGWISLNCENIYNGITQVLCARNGQGQSDYSVSVDNNYNLTGFAWSNNLGWLCFGSTCSKPQVLAVSPGADPAPDGQHPYLLMSATDGKLSGWAKVLSMGNEGWLRFDNQEDPLYNVYFNSSTQSLEGLAWGAAKGDNAQIYGIGPIDFSRAFTSYPWLETKYGNIYSSGGLGSVGMLGAPSSSVSAAGVKYNATYCLLTGGKIVNFRTQSQTCNRQDYTKVTFPNSSNNYQTTLGFVPLNDLIAQAIKSNTNIQASDLGSYFGSAKILGNKVYHFSGFQDYYINDPINFLNNISANSSGAGTIIIEGNLHIKSDIYYDDSHLIGKIGNLASVAFIVLGDVIVDPTVQHLVGDWLVLGNPVCPGNQICGQFLTGDDTANPTQFTLQGLVLAKQFQLQRHFRQGTEPAESFVYDGRVNVNTPPGLHNVSFSLPQWNSQ